MKVTIIVELEDGKHVLSERLTSEAPTAAMLRTAGAVVAIKQIPEVIKHLFERKELEDAKRKEAAAGDEVKALPAAQPGVGAEPAGPVAPRKAKAKKSAQA